MQRRYLISLFALVIVAGGSYAALKLSFGSPGIPEEFQNARLDGALVSQNIANIAGSSTDNLEKVNQLVNQDHNYVDALNLTTQIIGDSQKIRDQAATLSGDLEKMTESLSSVRSFEARQAALEAISNRLALMSRLINYSNDLERLLEAVRGELSGTPAKDGQITSLVNEVNNEVQAINNFNAQANQAMDRFDAAVK